MYWHNYVFT